MVPAGTIGASRCCDCMPSCYSLKRREGVDYGRLIRIGRARNKDGEETEHLTSSRWWWTCECWS